ncbi:hypothetical protein CTI14_30785, partial [Methylobacterium radiotolerans]
GAAAGPDTSVSASDAVGNVQTDATARGYLPADIRDSGVLKIGGEADVPPYLYTDGGKTVGLEADFMVAISKVLGLSPQIQNTQFASMVTGLTSKRFDVAMSDFSDTPERQKQVSFIDYTKAGQQLVVQKGNPKHIQSVSDLCGTTAGGPTGSLSVKVVQDQSTKCTAAGKPAIDIKQFPSTSEANLALQNKRIDSMGIDAGIAAFLTKGQAAEVTGGLFASATTAPLSARVMPTSRRRSRPHSTASSPTAPTRASSRSGTWRAWR